MTHQDFNYINVKFTGNTKRVKIRDYGKYAALTALGTYILLNPKKAQAASPTDPGIGF